MYTIQQMEAKIEVRDLLSKYQDRERFIKYCMDCPEYNAKWSCPPTNFDVNEFLLHYQYAHMICTKIIFNAEVIEENREPSKINEISSISTQTVREVLADNLLNLEMQYPDSISILSGSCKLCKECMRMNQKPCIHPDQMRYSLDTFGLDLTCVIKDLFNVELKWAKGRLPEYYSLTSAFLTNCDLQGKLL